MLVLAGGFGTRLRSVLTNVPKPLAPVAGKPFLQYMLENWIAQGVDDFVLLLHYEAEMIENMLERMNVSGRLDGISVKTILESEPLGTGGAIKNALKILKLQDSFLVANADTWLGSGVKELVMTSPCALGAIKVKNCKRYGSLLIDKENKILEFQE